MRPPLCLTEEASQPGCGPGLLRGRVHLALRQPFLRHPGEASLSSEPPDTMTWGSPAQTDVEGKTLQKICWFEKFKSDFFFFFVKRIKIQPKPITSVLGLFWEAAIKDFILLLSLLPLQLVQVCEAIKPSPSPQPRAVCPAPFLLWYCALGKKRKLNSY